MSNVKVTMKALCAFLSLGILCFHAESNALVYNCFRATYGRGELSVDLTFDNATAVIAPGEIYKLVIVSRGIPAGYDISEHVITVHGSSGNLPLATRKTWPLNMKSLDDTLYFKGDTIGHLQYIKIELGAHKQSEWYPQRLTVMNPKWNEEVDCTCTNKTSGNKYRNRRSISRAMRVSIHTSGEWFAGTGANVYIKIHGDNSKSSYKQIHGNFNRYKVATTTVHVGDIGRVTGITLNHDNSGTSPGWHVDKVTIYEESEAHYYHFHCDHWINKEQGLTREFGITGGECSKISYCRSQRCRICDNCFDKSSTYFYGRKSNVCFRCRRIKNCKVEVCPSSDGQVCSRCDGNVGNNPGSRAYFTSNDQRSCIQACSWRSDSTRCYPGTCTTEAAKSCVCAYPFTGHHCETISQKPTILGNQVIFRQSSVETAQAPLDPNVVTTQEPSWTNLKEIHNINCEFKSHFTPTGIVTDRPTYIEDYKVGIIGAYINFTFIRGEVHKEIEWYNCTGASTYETNRSTHTCRLDILNISTLIALPLITSDMFRFEYVTENGGYVRVNNKEDLTVSTFTYNGKSSTTSVSMGIDYDNPYHCLETIHCKDSMLTVKDTVLELPVSLSWDGWTDDVSGLHHYDISVFEMGYIASETALRNKRQVLSKQYNASIQKGAISLEDSGIYAIELSALDKAGNSRTTRRIIIYDGESKILKMKNSHLRVTTASQTSSWAWQWTTGPVNVAWYLRYHNKKHNDNKWLEKALAVSDVDALYDDNEYARGVNSIPNVQGITEYRTTFMVDHQGGTTITRVPDESAFTSQYLNQSQTISPALDDGDTLRYWIRAYDIRRECLEENVTVHIDTSPPVIQNLWLTRGDRLNISVHHIEELNEMIIEWESYDEHSGVERVSWRLFDNFTGDEVLHGTQHLSAQGDAKTEADCKAKYGHSSRGAVCYCTPGVGCYHRHFQVKPTVIKDDLQHGGIFHSKYRGEHDYDYYIEVTVTNHAQLTTTLDFKISIDASPPHSGIVYDGQTGQSDKDYQSDLQLHTHWEGFFDKESGVKFYQYGFADTCLKASDFGFQSSSPLVQETFSTHASWLSSAPGRYFVTVVAFNHGLDPSPPACSDGITVDKSKPTLSQIAVLNSHTTEGLVTTVGGEVWLISKDRRRSQILQPDILCRNKGRLMSEKDVSMVPFHRYANNTVITHQPNVCDQYNTFALQTVNTFFVSRENMLYMNWTSDDEESGIYDFELGLTSNPSNIGAPDVLPFSSTHHHPQFIGYHTDISEGQQINVVIKATNKAGLSVTEVIGPVTVQTQAPVFSGPITSSRTNSTLVSRWSENTFNDFEESYLKYEFAVGSTQGGTELLPFRPLQSGEGCFSTSPPLCTAVALNDLHWDMHHGHTYFVSVKVTNIVDMWTVGVSEPYLHNVRLPSVGVVLEVSPEEERHLFDTTEFEDSDFQLSTTSLTTRWYGFDDGLDGVNYKVCIGTVPGTFDIHAFEDVGRDLSYTFLNLRLDTNKRYFVTVSAANNAGTTTQASDGFTVLMTKDDVSDVTLHDGEAGSTDSGHDTDFQVSTSSYSGHWSYSNRSVAKHRDVHWRIEKKIPGTADMWMEITNYENLGDTMHVDVEELALEPGNLYRSAVMFCAVQVCTNPVYSDGVTVMSHPPAAGDMNVTYSEIGEKSQIEIDFHGFYDPDILDDTESYDAIDRYEWSLTDNAHGINLLIPWKPVTDIVRNQNQVAFTVSLPKHLSFVKCRRLSVRGYNKAGLYTTVSTDVRDCSAHDPNFIVPAIVIDAIGSPANEQHTGKGISLEKNAIWPQVDADYTPYDNVLSAVWPSLRHGQYTWAVVAGDRMDPVSHYKRENIMTVPDPCSLPDVVKCGETDKEFVNVVFNNTKWLAHGTRFYICIHANETSVQYEKWTTILAAVNECSDGITIDLTPPSPGTVTIDDLRNGVYQVSKTVMSVSWSGFVDVEEYKTASHPSGISTYKVELGSTPESHDILSITDVGHVDHVTLTGLVLHDGQTVYATIQATDFVNQTTGVSSSGCLIDSSPPITTSKQIVFEERYSTSSIMFVCWNGVFYDPESGIQHYDVSLGSRPGHADIDIISHVTDTCINVDISSKVKDGHSFHVSVKAYNKANLHSVLSSHPHVFDTSPPSVGHVFDGRRNYSLTKMKDKDYVTSVEQMGAFWEGFSDPQSGISHFKIKVGTCSGCQDTLAEYTVGSRTDVVFLDAHLSFEKGTKYYVTVAACNMANTCSSSTSDGVILDQSPPVQGKVMDGTHDTDIQYQASRTFLGCKWHGFQDPESGLDHYEWRVGTIPGGDDILSMRYAALEEIIFHTMPNNHQLPTGQKIYSTIRAVNKAGLHTEAFSNGFIIDDTPPVFTNAPHPADGQGSIIHMTSISRTNLRVKWEVADDMSYIEKQYISMSSHQLGEFSSSLMELPGMLRDFTFTNLNLRDGSRYNVKLTVCNMAGLCTMSSTGDILVDGSAPLPGTLAVATDHAADLSRHESGGMLWNASSVTLAWLGFADLHSGIDHYIVTVGSTPFNTDLEDNTQPTKVSHYTNGVDKEDEGVVQIFNVKTTDISKRKSLFVSVSAVNGVGLKSKPLLSELTLGAGDALELVRRCTAYDCEGHCVCFKQDQKCPRGAACVVPDTDGPYSKLTVLDIIDLQQGNTDEDVDFSPFDTFLAASWTVNDIKALHNQQNPVRYQFSAGDSQYDTPTGIFDNAHDRVWFDAGKSQRAVIVLERDQYLEPGHKYSVFVRAWYNNITYRVFKSDGVIIHNRRPTLTTKLGKSVREHKNNSLGKDVDFQSFTDSIFINWSDKFIQGVGGIYKYMLHICTSQGGHSIHSSPHLATDNYIASGLSLELGTVYYSCVLAYTSTGAVNWACSDGVQPDLSPPIAGHIRDGNELFDLDYQTSTTDITASWYGFSDTDSSIVKYVWCAGILQDAVDCSLLDWRDVGLHTSIKAKINSTISDGTKIWTKVFAVDAVGHPSAVVVSDGITVDASAPEIKDVAYLGNNLVSNPSFEEIIDVFHNNDSTCTRMIPTSWEARNGSCIKSVTSDILNAKNDQNYVSVSGSMKQTVDVLTVGKRYSLIVHAGYPESLSLKHIAVGGSIALGGEVFTFTLDPYLCKGTCDREKQPAVLWSTQSFQFLAEATSSDLVISTSSRHMEMAVDHVTLREVDYSGESVHTEEHITVHPVFLPHWSSVHVMWHMDDEHSPITEYKWAAGTVRGGTQIQPFVSAGRHNHATLSGLRLTHKQKLYLTITAKNAAGLTTVSHPDPITVDMTPPVFSYINDGTGSDIDYQEIGDVHVNWKIEDEETGVRHCNWAVGTIPGSADLKAYERHTGQHTSVMFDVRPHLTNTSLTVYTTVRCYNKVGLMASATTDGVTVMRSDTTTFTDGIQLQQDTTLYYPVRGTCHVSEKIQLKWALKQLQSTVVKITDDIRMYKLTIPSQYQFGSISGLQLKNLDNYMLEIYPESVTGSIGNVTHINVTLHDQPPVIQQSAAVTVTRNGHQLSLSWAGLFQSSWDDVLFVLNIGSVLGGADILEGILTRNTEIQLTLTSRHHGLTAAYVTVTAVDLCGYTKSYTQQFNLI